MTRRRIPGPIRYDLLAQLHRPAEPATLAREARALLALGMTVRDAAQAMQLPPRAVADLLQHPEARP